ncbi:MAG: hypothetical protein IPN76_34920 [Saprospiraceae bacterium]|nr:hypothetical protein [Saprospiraceae bacterium]
MSISATEPAFGRAERHGHRLAFYRLSPFRFQEIAAGVSIIAQTVMIGTVLRKYTICASLNGVRDVLRPEKNHICDKRQPSLFTSVTRPSINAIGTGISTPP